MFHYCFYEVHKYNDKNTFSHLIKKQCGGLNCLVLSLCKQLLDYKNMCNIWILFLSVINVVLLYVRDIKEQSCN